MKKRISILGSTGSIGENTLKILRRDKKDFEINLLTTNKNISKVFKQAKEFKVRNIIITDLEYYKKAKIQFKDSKFNFYNKTVPFEHAELIKELPFKKNQMSLHVKTFNSLHGVGPINNQNIKETLFRKSISIFILK